MTTGKFTHGSDRAREAGRKGGQVRAAQRRQAAGPYQGTILDVMDVAGLGPSWAAWRTFLKSIFALPMDADELETFTRHTEREQPPEEPVAGVSRTSACKRPRVCPAGSARHFE